MKNTKRKHLKLCLLLLFMVLGCFAITNVRTTNGAGIIADVQIKWQNLEPIWKSIMAIHLIRYCIKKFPDVTNRLRNRQDISSTDFLRERNCIFQVLTMKLLIYQG